MSCARARHTQVWAECIVFGQVDPQVRCGVDRSLGRPAFQGINYDDDVDPLTLSAKLDQSIVAHVRDKLGKRDW